MGNCNNLRSNDLRDFLFEEDTHNVESDMEHESIYNFYS